MSATTKRQREKATPETIARALRDEADREIALLRTRLQDCRWALSDLGGNDMDLVGIPQDIKAVVAELLQLRRTVTAQSELLARYLAEIERRRAAVTDLPF